MSDQVPGLGRQAWHVYLLLDRSASLTELREATGLAESTVRGHLATLHEHGLVAREGRGGTATYRRSVDPSGDVLPIAQVAGAQYVRDTAHCPNCGHMVASGAGDCSNCSAAAASRTQPRRPAADPATREALALLAGISLAVVIALLSLQLGDQADRTSPAGDNSGAQVASATPTAASATPTADNTENTTTPARRNIQLMSVSYSAKPFQTVPLEGRYVGPNGRTTLRVQRQHRNKWVSFPLPTVTDRSGNFNAYVELGEPGTYRLRVADLQAEVVSEVIVLRVT